jgi:hypothetical protein
VLPFGFIDVKKPKMRLPIVLLLSSLAACSNVPTQALAPEKTSPSVSGAMPPGPPAGAQINAQAGRIARPVLSAQGYGPARFGTRLSDVERVLEEKSEHLGTNDPACHSVRFNQLPGVRFMVENGIITRADAGPGTPNELGLAAGDTLAQAKNKYPGIEVGPHKYLPAGHYLTIRGADAKSAIVMEEDGKRITAIRAGLEPAVAYVEGCL